MYHAAPNLPQQRHHRDFSAVPGRAVRFAGSFPYPSKDPGSYKTWFGFDVFLKLMGQQQGLVKSPGHEPFFVKGNWDHAGKIFLHSVPDHP